MNEIIRTSHEQHLTRLLRENPVVALLGARQVGKTTLAKALMRDWDGEAIRFDLEDPRDLGQLDEPMLALEPLRGLVVIDECATSSRALSGTAGAGGSFSFAGEVSCAGQRLA